jgi:hypothetical protein
MELGISLQEALFGFERTLTHLDGSEFILTSPHTTTSGEITTNNDILTVEGLGMPIYTQNTQSQSRPQRGRLYVKVRLDLPSRMWLTTEEQRETLRGLLPDREGKVSSPPVIKPTVPQEIDQKSSQQVTQITQITQITQRDKVTVSGVVSDIKSLIQDKTEQIISKFKTKFGNIGRGSTQTIDMTKSTTSNIKRPTTSSPQTQFQQTSSQMRNEPIKTQPIKSTRFNRRFF